VVPILLTSDRIVLSHVAPAGELTDYAVCMQIFAPVAALLSAAAQPLWPIYIEAREKGGKAPDVWLASAAFGAATAVVCTGLVVVAAPLGRLIGDDGVELGIGLPVAAGLVMVAMGVSAPLGLSLTTPAELRFAAKLAVTVLPVNLGLSIWFADLWGAPGPLIATIVAAIPFQTLPAMWFVRRRGRVAATSAAAP
jgi:O-antigen/teichoic acid export membrane protein